MTIETMKLALEALEAIHPEVVCTVANHTPKYRHENAACGVKKRHVQATTALRQAIEQAEQPQPVTYGEVMRTMNALRTGTLEQQQAYGVMKDEPLYTAPPPRQPLTDEQLPAMWSEAVRKAAMPPNKSALIHYKEAIEAAHGIKE